MKEIIKALKGLLLSVREYAYTIITDKILRYVPSLLQDKKDYFKISKDE